MFVIDDVNAVALVSELLVGMDVLELIEPVRLVGSLWVGLGWLISRRLDEGDAWVIWLVLVVSDSTEALRVRQLYDVVLKLDKLLWLFHNNRLRVRLIVLDLTVRLVDIEVFILSFAGLLFTSVFVVFILSFSNLRRSPGASSTLILAILSLVLTIPLVTFWLVILTPIRFHLLNRLFIVINDIALVCQISVQEAAKNHDLVIWNSDASQLGSLLVTKFSVYYNRVYGCVTRKTVKIY